MLAEAGGAPYEARQAYRRTLDIELEAPAVDPRDEQSVTGYVRYKRERERDSPEAVAQQRRQEDALADVTL
jgi:hypothetical protein